MEGGTKPEKAWALLSAEILSFVIYDKENALIKCTSAACVPLPILLGQLQDV